MNSSSLGLTTGTDNQSTALIIVLSLLVVIFAIVSITLGAVANQRGKALKHRKLDSRNSFPPEVALEQQPHPDSVDAATPRVIEATNTKPQA